MEQMSRLEDRLFQMRTAAKARRDPTCADDTLAYLLRICQEEKPERILEIGTAEGLTALALLLSTEADYTGIEIDPDRARKARENFQAFGVAERTTFYEGDAGEILPLLEGTYDLIFLDGPKVQYKKYLPDCKRLLRRGGVLLSDDVLLFGWVRGEPPKKRRMFVSHIREYLNALDNDSELKTQILEIGEGLGVSRKL